MADNIIPLAAHRIARPLSPAASLTQFERARQEMIAAYIEWLRIARPCRDDALTETEGTAAQMRQLATLNSWLSNER